MEVVFTKEEYQILLRAKAAYADTHPNATLQEVMCLAVKDLLAELDPTYKPASPLPAQPQRDGNVIRPVFRRD